MTQRLTREFDNLLIDPVANCSAALVSNDITHWKAAIIGPNESPYEGGIFYLDIKFNDSYPFKPPNVYFITKILNYT